MKRIAIAFACALGGSALLAVPQQPTGSPQRPIFRSGALLVNVDAYPTRDGRFMTGLTPADFDVTEDGVPQKIEVFDYLHFDELPADTERRDPLSQEEGDLLAGDPRHRAFVVYIDPYHLTPEAARTMRQPVIEFLHRLIGPTDYFAALTPDVSVADLVFGQRTETIDGAIDKYWRRTASTDQLNIGGMPEATSEHERFLKTCFIGRLKTLELNEALIRELFNRWRTERLISGLHDLILRLPQIRDGRTNVLLVSSPWPRFSTASNLMDAAWNSPRGIGDAKNGRLTIGAQQPGAIDMQSCDTELLRLAALDEHDMFKALLDAALRANVAFDTIDPAGLAAFDGSKQASGYDNPATAGTRTGQLSMNLDELRVLAINTNGAAIVATNDLRTPLRKLADDLSSYYLLGYYTTNPKLDGKYRNINVKMKAAGAKVAARRGYFGPTDAMVHPPAAAAATGVSPAAAGETDLIKSALKAIARREASAPLAIYAAASSLDTAIVVEIGSDESAHWADGADVTAVVAANGGGTTRSSGRIEPGTRSVVLHVPSPASPAQVRITVKGSGGTLNDTLEFEPASLSLLSEPLIFRAMASPRAPLQAVADMRFLRSERVRVEWTTSTPGNLLERREARLLDRMGQPLAVTVNVTEHQVSGRTVLDADLALAPLGTGDYLIEVVASSGTAPAERRLVAIHVER